MYTIIKEGKYLYKTYRGDYIFADVTNVLFDTEEQATNWLHFNSDKFDSEGAHVEMTLKMV